MKISIIVFIIGVCYFVSEFITLEDLKWKKRVILIFPALNDSFEIAFSDSLRLEMEVRDMVYFVFTDSLYSNTGYAFTGEYIQELKSRYFRGQILLLGFIGKRWGGKVEAGGKNGLG